MLGEQADANTCNWVGFFEGGTNISWLFGHILDVFSIVFFQSTGSLKPWNEKKSFPNKASAPSFEVHLHCLCFLKQCASFWLVQLIYYCLALKSYLPAQKKSLPQVNKMNCRLSRIQMQQQRTRPTRLVKYIFSSLKLHIYLYLCI